jgi:hypothetical protein
MKTIPLARAKFLPWLERITTAQHKPAASERPDRKKASQRTSGKALGDQAWHPEREAMALAAKAVEAMAVRPEPTPVHIHMAEQPITVMPAEVTVQPAAVIVEAAQITMPEQQAPVVNITNIPPGMTVEPASINVTLPEQAAPVVNITLPEQKPTTKTVQRDQRGQITAITEEPTNG